MLERKIAEALRGARPEPPMGFDARSDSQLRCLTAKEEQPMKKVSGLALALVLTLLLGMTAALAAGVITWQRGLEDALQMTEDAREVYSGTALIDEPQLSVTDCGVTVTLETCIVDGHAAYIAFRVAGYEPPVGMQPAFDRVSCSAGLTSGEASSGSFYNGLRVGEDGRAAYLDGSPVDWTQPLPYVAENGDLMYIISMTAAEETYPGRTMTATLSGLGAYENKWGDVRVDVPGTWSFQWTLKGTDDAREMTGLQVPVGSLGAVLNSVRLSPIAIELRMSIPRQPEHEDDGLNIPYFVGVRMKNGEEHLYIASGGSEGYISESSDEVRARWSLDHMLIPDDVASLLFTLPAEGDAIIEVPME